MSPLLFTDPAFLCFFAPLVLTACWLAPAGLRDLVLLFTSLGLYWWSEGAGVLVLVGLVLVDWLACAVLFRRQTWRKPVLIAGLAVLIAPLLWFRYSFFVVSNLNLALAGLGIARLPEPAPHAPAGLSFLTFMAIASVVDYYRRDVSATPTLTGTGLYLSLFPHLAAGPILRMPAFAPQLGMRTLTLDHVGLGARRFMLGLAKKMLIANVLAAPADAVFSLAPSQMPAAYAWTGLICFTLQIYYDFSGYTDMAIGLAQALGFQFPENFRYPYAAESVADFWRRWHITLSQWLRDYLFFPLGVRGGVWVRVRNQFVVFVLCGLWHGAAWQFVVWGLWHAVFLAFEQLSGWGKLAARLPQGARSAYTMTVVMLGWVFFRSESTHYAAGFLKALFGFGGPAGVSGAAFFERTVSPLLVLVVVIGGIAALPVGPWLRARVEAVAGVRWSAVVENGVLATGFLASLGAMASESFHPFLYFRF